MTTILVVDDMAVFREPIALSLRAKGFDILCASNGREALETLRRHRPDLMLLDVAMPEMDGMEVLRAIQADAAIKRCPIILLTALAEREYVVQAAALGAHDYLLKSQFSLDLLVARIKRALSAASAPPGSNTPSPSIPKGAAPSNAAAGAGADANRARTSAARPQTTSQTQAPSTPAASVDSIDDASEQLKELKPLLNRSEMNERLDGCGEMKALSPVVAEVIKLTSSDRTSLDQIAKVIKRDHAIALKVLKLANSAVYNRGDTVDSLDQAISRIGLGSIRQAVMNMAVIDQFAGDAGQKGGIRFSAGQPFDALQFWEHSIACGLISSEIAVARSDKEPDLAFTMGLLHDVGRLVYMEALSDLYAQVFEVATRTQLPLERVESKLLLLNHADCMDRIMHLWHFPKNLIDPIVFHHLSIGNMRRMASKRIEEVATLGLANRLSHALLLGYSGNEVIYPTEGLCQHLKLSPALVQRLEDTIRDQTNEIKFTMLASAGHTWTDRRETWLKRLKEPLRPLFVSMAPEYDAYRIFCEQLRDRADDKPNLTVIHFADARELAAVSTRAMQAEEQAGVKGLPLVVLSPKGDLRPPPSITDDRICHQLPTPVTVTRLLSAINMALTGRAPLAAAA